MTTPSTTLTSFLKKRSLTMGCFIWKAGRGVSDVTNDNNFSLKFDCFYSRKGRSQALSKICDEIDSIIKGEPFKIMEGDIKVWYVISFHVQTKSSSKNTLYGSYFFQVTVCEMNLSIHSNPLCKTTLEKKKLHVHVSTYSGLEVKYGQNFTSFQHWVNS